MEITIKLNDYKEETEIRQEVVQGICDAFLSTTIHRRFHPFQDPNGRGYRNSTLYVVGHIKGGKKEKCYGFCRDEASESSNDEYTYKIRRTEMQSAFEVLIKAGYHIFKKYDYDTWLTYVCEKKPFIENGVEVFKFNDFIS